MEQHARARGITRLTIGVEEKEGRNRAIHAHWGYTEALFSEREDGEEVLYFCKELAVRREQQMVKIPACLL